MLDAMETISFDLTVKKGIDTKMFLIILFSIYKK